MLLNLGLSLKRFKFFLQVLVVKLKLGHLLLPSNTFTIAALDFGIMLSVIFVKLAFFKVLLPCLVVHIRCDFVVMLNFETDVHVGIDSSLNGGISKIISSNSQLGKMFVVLGINCTKE